MLIINLIGFIIACIALIASGGFLVKSLSRISKFLRISELTFGHQIIFYLQNYARSLLKALMCGYFRIIMTRVFQLCYFYKAQWLPYENGQSPFYVVNEVTLTGQKPSLKFCLPFEIFTQFEKGLDLLMLKIWGL